MTAAVFGALQRRNISYIEPPASFEKGGQKIRTPSQILADGLATCLDLSVLVAACLEQAGLNPIIPIVTGHSLVGVWLTDDHFPEPAIDDVSRVRKRIDLREIDVFDATLVTHRPIVGFDHAERIAHSHLGRLAAFDCAVDLKNARNSSIRPLPNEHEQPAAPRTENRQEQSDDLIDPPTTDEHIAVAEQFHQGSPTSREPEGPGTKLEKWRNKLLDLSLRNRLLNYKRTKRAVPLVVSSIARLEDKLAAGVTFQLFPKPVLPDLGPNTDSVLEADRLSDYLEAQMKARRLHTDLTEKELTGRLTTLYRQSRMSREEGGANTLFLAVGLLKWFEAPSSQTERLAPLLLLPLEMHRKSVGSPFKIELGEDDGILNVSLLQKLKGDYGIELSGIDHVDLPTDASGLDVPLILQAFREAVRDQARWEVVESGDISLFTFNKFLMWNDLNARLDDLMANPVVKQIVDDEPLVGGEGQGICQVEDLDNQVHPKDVLCPLDADSSQLQAVLSTAQGASFVVHGPPGTGKSQTITNLVAHCVGKGQRVLFVSEKMAALGVVHERLDQIGLGPFCLELHSNKARKAAVAKELGKTLGITNKRIQSDWETHADALAARRAAVNRYVETIRRHRKLGKSVFDVTSLLIGLRSAPFVRLGFDVAAEGFEESDFKRLEEVVDRFETAATTVGVAMAHPWRAAQAFEWTPTLPVEVEHRLTRLDRAAVALQAATKDLSETIGAPLDRANSRTGLELTGELVRLLSSYSEPPRTLLDARPWRQTRDEANDWINHGQKRSSACDIKPNRQ